MITFTQKGDFSKLNRYLNFLEKLNLKTKLDEYGEIGVKALSSNTPIESGKTASSWYYEVKHTNNSITISYLNSNINDGVPIAIILQYGHGTGTGGWVEGRDYINPAIQPIFDNILSEAWKEVTKL